MRVCVGVRDCVRVSVGGWDCVRLYNREGEILILFLEVRDCMRV